MDKYLLCVFSHNKFPICGEMAGWGVSGLQTGSELHHLVGSRVVLIQWAALGPFMRRGMQWACAGVGPIEQWV